VLLLTDTNAVQQTDRIMTQLDCVQSFHPVS